MRTKSIFLLLLLAVMPLCVFSQSKSTFEIKNGHFYRNGKITPVLSGEMHYARIPHQYWRHRLQMMKGMGLNTVATYVFWNLHEPEPGKWDFTGDKNLAEFIKTAGEEGMMVILRPGPYVCAEWEFGGYPWWLQNVKGMEIRRDNPEFLKYTKAYIDRLYKEVGSLQCTKGGPIVMVQCENEFGSYVAQRKDIPLEEHRAYNAKIKQQMECVTPEVTDKEIDAVLERRRAMAAELVPHKGPAVKGNIVHIDYEGLLEGKPFNGGAAQNQTLQLGSGRMIPGFEEGILGHKGGEEFDIFVTFPARYHVKDLAGKPVVFKIKLHDVCVRQLPALNSDFAKKAANVDTMDEFRAQIRQQLHDNKHAAALNRAKDAILTQLAAAAEGELPSVLVESAYQQEMEQIQQQLQMQRLSLDRYLSQIHQTRESFTAAVRTAAEKNTRARMALLQIAQNEDLVPTEEDIDKTLSERAERTKKTLEEVKAASNVEAIRRNEGIRRAADYVIEHSTIEEK